MKSRGGGGREPDLDELDRRMTETDLQDRALVHAGAQIAYYLRHMRRNRYRYTVLESGSLLLGSAATVLAALSAPPWVTAAVAATVTFLAGIRRVFNWHADWLAHSEAWSRASALLAQYRLLAPAERSPQRQRELVRDIDDLVVEQTRTWGKRRRELLSQETSRD
jgi:Protein of unknown function (DUF4231)